MIDWLISGWDNLPNIFVSTILLFALLIVWIRITGLRSFAKISSIDFASTIAIGSILASTILSKSPSIVQGGMAIAFVLLFQYVFSKLTLKNKWFNTLVSNEPMLLMKGEHILDKNLHSANLSKADLMAKLREANVIQLSEVKAVVLETTGDISVLHTDDEKTIDEALLKEVKS